MENLHKFQQMQEEMSRFEAEISGSNAAVGCLMQPMMAAGSFGTMPQGMDTGAMHQYQHTGLTAFMFQPMPPPPPPPQILMMPQQDFQGFQPHSYPVHLGPPSHHEYQLMQLQYLGMPEPQLMGPPPTPIFLSAKPKLYKKPMDDAKKEKHEMKQKRKAERKAAKEAAVLASVPTLMSPPPPLPPQPPPPPAHTELVAKPKKEKKNRKMVRTAGGQIWEDATLLDWDDDDFRMFCGDLGNDVTDDLLIRTFGKYASFQRAKVVRDKRTNKSKGFGFVSFKDPEDFIKAMKEMDGCYVGSRPIKLRKSTWQHRSMDVVRRKEEEKDALISLLMTASKN